MQLSLHFSLNEFLISQTAARMGREIVPPPVVVENLRRLCVTVLEPIRAKLQRPMVVSSGYRPDWLNLAIGGSKTSAHMRGCAADLEIVGMSPEVFSKWVQYNAPLEGWPIDQCILEFPPNGWTHIGIAEVPRHEYLTARSQDGRTVYVNGLQA